MIDTTSTSPLTFARSHRRPQDATPQPAPTPPARPLPPLDEYELGIGHLPGAVRVAEDDQGLCVYTKSKRDSQFLGTLLEPTIEGLPVHFVETGTPRPPQPKHPRPGPDPHEPDTPDRPDKPAHPRPKLSPAESVSHRYGKAIAMLPHVVGVKPATDGSNAIVVSADSADAVRHLSGIVEDHIHGVLVEFQGPTA